MNTIVKKIIKKIVKKDYCYEVLTIDNDLILFANQGSIEDIRERLNEKLIKYNKMLKSVNIATAYIVPISHAQS